MPRRDYASDVVEVLANDLTYIPNPEQRKVKAAFWTRFMENPFCEPKDIQKGDIYQLTSDNRLDRWWSQPGFKEWFRNQEEFRERVEALAMSVLDRLAVILASDDPKMSNAQVQASKLLLEVARKMPPKYQQDKYVDEKIGKMDKKELEAFVAERVHLLPVKKNESDSLTEDHLSENMATDD